MKLHWDADWRVRLKNFDAVFEPVPQPERAPTPQDENKDLSVEQPQVDAVTSSAQVPPSLSPDEFKQKFPEVTASVTINMGQNIVCHCAQNKIFISSASRFLLAGLDAASPKALFVYAGGSWISDSSKAQGDQNLCLFTLKQSLFQAKDYMSKAANESKAVAFELANADSTAPSLFRTPFKLVKFYFVLLIKYLYIFIYSIYIKYCFSERCYLKRPVLGVQLQIPLQYHCTSCWRP